MGRRRVVGNEEEQYSVRPEERELPAPDASAVIAGATVTTSGELAAEVEWAAGVLAARGVTPDQVSASPWSAPANWSPRCWPCSGWAPRTSPST